MWPIKWKEILYRITIWNQKMSQYNSLESALQIGLIFFYFEDYSKSARGMILFLLVTCSYIPILLKNAEKPTVIWLSTENFFKSTVRGKLQFLYSNKDYLNQQTRKLLCQALIFSSLEYCSSSWYNGLSVSLSESLNVFSRVHATLQPALSVGQSVGWSVTFYFFLWFYFFDLTAPAQMV